MKAVGASDRVFEILNRRPKMVALDMDEAAVKDANYDCDDTNNTTQRFQGNIEFETSNFRMLAGVMRKY